jgi:hypothetical protein
MFALIYRIGWVAVLRVLWNNVVNLAKCVWIHLGMLPTLAASGIWKHKHLRISTADREVQMFSWCSKRRTSVHYGEHCTTRNENTQCPALTPAKFVRGYLTSPMVSFLPVPTGSYWHHSKWLLKPNYCHQYGHLGIQYCFHYELFDIGIY